LFWDSPCLLKI